MKTFSLNGVEISFPFAPYPSQIQLMSNVLKSISQRSNALLESPTGSGKSLALLCASLAWQAKEKTLKEKVAQGAINDIFVAHF
jgi:Fanconi anemia group J protein